MMQAAGIVKFLIAGLQKTVYFYRSPFAKLISEDSIEQNVR